MGPDVAGPGTGYPLTNDDWFELGALITDEHAALNRTRSEAVELVEHIVRDPYTEVWVVRGPGDPPSVLGFAALHIGNKRSDGHTANLRIHMREGSRGKGHGSRLLRAATRWADSNGIERITATPYLGQDANVGFFTRFGFEPEGVARRAVRLDTDTYVDVAQLARVKPEPKTPPVVVAYVDLGEDAGPAWVRWPNGAPT